MKKILIVEDVDFNLDLMVQLLEDKFELLTAMDGAEGISAAKQHQPDLILMDMSLPGVDGWEATRQIVADPVLAQTPIIALTAHAMTGDEAKALACGCSAYLAKPVDQDLLFEKIDSLLSTSSL